MSMGNNDSDTGRAGSPVATNQIVQCAGWATHFFLKVINPRLRINLMKSKIANILGGDTRVGDSHTAIRAPQLSRWNERNGIGITHLYLLFFNLLRVRRSGSPSIGSNSM